MCASVDVEAQGTILHVFPHIYWSRGSQPDPELTDMVSLAYQLALDSPSLLLLSEAGITGGLPCQRDNVFFFFLNRTLGMFVW